MDGAAGTDETFREAERRVVTRLVLDNARTDGWFHEALKDLCIPPELLEKFVAALSVSRSTDGWEDAGMDPVLAAIEQALDDRLGDSLGQAVQDLLARVDYWDKEFVRSSCDLAIEALATRVGWTPSPPEPELDDSEPPNFESGDDDTKQALPLFAPRDRVHRFQFEFPLSYTYEEAAKRIADFTAGVATELWAETGFKDRMPNEPALARAVRCFYLLRVRDYSVRRTAAEVLGNPDRRTEVKQAERRIAAILGIDWITHDVPDAAVE